MRIANDLRTMAVALAGAFCLSLSANGSDDLSEHAIDPVIMVAGQMGGTPTFGAGIIFARQKDRLYAVTANHVVRSGGMSATDLTVKIRTAPNQSLPAHLLEPFDDRLDLAVLSIDNLSAQNIDVCSLSLDHLSLPDMAKRGGLVYPVGNPNGVAWTIPVNPDAISQTSGDDIVFQSSLIARGHSGGALINTAGQVLGMIQADEPPYGRALNIHKILQVLAGWKYATDMNVHAEGEDPPLIVATELGQVEQVKRLLGQACADPNFRSVEFGYRAIEIAARQGSLEMVKLLVDSGASFKDGGHDESILISAAFGGNPDIFRLLLAAGASCCNNSALSIAASEGEVEVLKILFSHGANPNPKGGRTLFFSALSGSIDAGRHPDKEAVVRTLIQAGGDVNLPDFDRQTPLLTAVSRGETGCVKMLLAAGANTEARGRDKETVWEILSHGNGSKDHEIAFALLTARTSAIAPEVGARLIDRAASEGWADVVGQLIQHGVNVKGVAGASAMMHAALGTHIEVMKLLLQSGTDPDAFRTDQTHETPLVSILHGPGQEGSIKDPAVRKEVVKLLLSYGAKVQRNRNGLYDTDPLYMALFECGDLDVAALLITHGANVNGKYDNVSFLHHAHDIHNQRVADFLLNHGGRDISNPTYPQ